MEIDWERLEPRQYEDMVSVLLSHMNHEVRRIDGSGGDEGRDSEFALADGPEIFQLKSYTGRMNAGRRRKVESSLARVADRNPVAWHLVVPIDPTPGEDEWFQRLQANYAFPITWKGRTWLNAQMAERPFISRYFTGGDSDRVIELLGELSREQAAVTDLNVGIDRLRNLTARINEIDPYYRFDVSIRDDNVEIAVHPRYEGAELDSPITFNMQLEFPQTDEGRAAAAEFQAAMDFGTRVTVEGEYIRSFEINGPAGISGNFEEGGSFGFGPPQPPEDWSLDIVLCVVDDTDTPLVELPIVLSERTAGRRGVIVRGADRPGALDVSMQIDVETRRVHVSFKFVSTENHYPHDLVPALTFVRHMVAPNQIKIFVGADRVPLGDTIEVPPNALIEEEYASLVENLARVQRETRTFFTMPKEFTYADLRELDEAIDLLDGKEVLKPWSEASFVLDVTDPSMFIEELRSNAEAGSYVIDGEGVATIAGYTLPLGRMRTRVPEARVANLQEAIERIESANEDSDASVEIRLEAIGEKTFATSLISG